MGGNATDLTENGVAVDCE